MDREGVLAELTRTEAAAILALRDESFPIRAARTGLLVMSPNRRSEIGKIKIGKTRISLQKLLLPAIEQVRIEDRAPALGDDPNALPLARYIDRKDLFTVLLDDITLPYFDRTFFRADALVRGGENSLRPLLAHPT